MSNVIDINGHAISSDAKRKLDIENIIKFAPNRSQALRRMAKQQVGMPTQVRMELAACAVTIEVQRDELAQAKAEIKSVNELLKNAQDLLAIQEDLLNKPCKACGQ